MPNIVIEGTSYELTARRAYDVLTLASVAKGKLDNDVVSNISVMAQVVSDSLKSTGLRLVWYKRMKYRKFIRGKGISLLVKTFTPLELAELFQQIYELEGGKKKVVENPDVPSDEKSAGE